MDADEGLPVELGQQNLVMACHGMSFGYPGGELLLSQRDPVELTVVAVEHQAIHRMRFQALKQADVASAHNVHLHAGEPALELQNNLRKPNGGNAGENADRKRAFRQAADTDARFLRLLGQLHDLAVHGQKLAALRRGGDARA